jgi:predicted membrane protein
MDDSQQKDPRPIGGQDLVAGVVVKGSLSARLIIGLVITGVGILLLLGSMGLVDIHFRDIMRCWPAILVAVGLVKVFSREGAATRVFGGVLATFGMLLLLDRFGYLNFDWKLMGPIAIVFLGITIVWRALAGSPTRASETDASATLGTVAIMGGANRKNTSQGFRGGEVTAVMGGAEIDLTQATPVPEGAVLELFAMWGGIEIQVPGDWTVENRVTPLMGGSEDTRKTVGKDGKKRLILKGLAIMGGVEVKN